MPDGKGKGSHHGREKKVYSEFQAAGSGGTPQWELHVGPTEPPLRHLLRTYSTLEEALRTRGLVEGPSLPEKELRARNAELERMVGRLTMENDLLKKAVEYTLRRRKENSSPITAKSLAASKGGVK